MVTLHVPRAHRKPLASMLTSSDESHRALLGALQTVPQSPVGSFAERVAREVGEEHASEAVGVLFSLHATFGSRDDSLAEFVDDVCDALRDAAEDIPGFEVDGVDWASSKERLSQLLSLESFAVVAKAVTVAMDQAHVFVRARVLTDARPVFREDVSSGPAAFVSVHTLKLTMYNAERHLEDYYLALDSDGIRSLKKVLERAIAKEESLEVALERSQVPVFELSDMSEET